MTDSSSSLSSITASSNHDEHDVDVSLARITEDALLCGIPSMLKLLLFVLDHLFAPETEWPND